MTETELDALGDLIGEVVRESNAPLLKRIAELESLVASIPVPRNGADGKDVDMELVRLAISGESLRAVTSVMPEVTARLDAFEQRIKEIPAGAVGEPGRPGADGAPGRDGLNGKDADPVTSEILTPMIADAVERAVAAIPVPKDGIDGKDAPAPDLGAIARDAARLIPLPKDGADGPAGPAGRDAEPVDTAALTAEVLRQIPIPQDGKSVDPAEVREMIAAEVRTAMAAIPVPKDGERGAPGKDAEPPHPDTLALLVVREVEKQVAALPKAKDGAPGEPGRDAIQTDILPAIDPRRSIPRGTFAQHGGCIVRANANTTPGEAVDLKEWDVILRGYNAPAILQGEDLRSFTFETRGIDGAIVSAQTFKIPAVIYRGVFREGEEYTRGDMVTWGGSTWHCIAERTGAKPGTTPTDWVLAVKEGRPGRDGKDGNAPAPAPKPPVKLQ